MPLLSNQEKYCSQQKDGNYQKLTFGFALLLCLLCVLVVCSLVTNFLAELRVLLVDVDKLRLHLVQGLPQARQVLVVVMQGLGLGIQVSVGVGQVLLQLFQPALFLWRPIKDDTSSVSQK